MIPGVLDTAIRIEIQCVVSADRKSVRAVVSTKRKDSETVTSQTVTKIPDGKFVGVDIGSALFDDSDRRAVLVFRTNIFDESQQD